ncbi:hypothetical protein HCN73_04860 [Lactobacillus crispatus]|uniref:hypothetical protein n=1 Tax=Lactobacillus crispatus TaxID=47770 RepID=UPI0015EB492C|nr:hypothetical protein [Lactobacillus crispatus]MBA2915514.1 hypothetical protein [Lactobacillus crispatus]MBA2915674.1 hypothetical protein [Lactobacillus crispatus]
MVENTKETAVESTTPETIDVHLTADQASMIEEILNNYTYGYRSDHDVDCKREIVKKDKIGTYPYPAKAPDPSIKKPVYDWINDKWNDKSEDGINKLFENVNTLVADNKEKDNQIQDLQKAILESNKSNTMLGMQFNAFGQQVTGILKQVQEAVNDLKPQKDNETPEKAEETETKPTDGNGDAK